jgi:four helix bundle protein
VARYAPAYRILRQHDKENEVRYTEWEASVPAALRDDLLWRRQDYRLALYAADLGWDDVRRLTAERASSVIADQLARALGSVSANIAEGYSRSSGLDRVRFYEYALGSARESRDWYQKARRTLGPATTRHRLKVLTSVVRLLTHAIPYERAATIRKQSGDASPRPHPPRDLHAVVHATRDTQ